MLKQFRLLKSTTFINRFVVIMLGITSVFVVWSTWASMMHGINQYANQQKYKNMISVYNASYSKQFELRFYDIMLINRIMFLFIDAEHAKNNNNEIDAGIAASKAANLIENRISLGMNSDMFQAAFEWADTQNESDNINGWVSPYFIEDWHQSYFKEFDAIKADADVYLNQSEQDSNNGSAYAMVTVLFSIVMFLYGIVNALSNENYKLALICVGLGLFVTALIYMATIPLPTGYTLFT